MKSKLLASGYLVYRQELKFLTVLGFRGHAASIGSSTAQSLEPPWIVVPDSPDERYTNPHCRCSVGILDWERLFCHSLSAALASRSSSWVSWSWPSRLTWSCCTKTSPVSRYCSFWIRSLRRFILFAWASICVLHSARESAKDLSQGAKTLKSSTTFRNLSQIILMRTYFRRDLQATRYWKRRDE